MIKREQIREVAAKGFKLRAMIANEMVRVHEADDPVQWNFLESISVLSKELTDGLCFKPRVESVTCPGCFSALYEQAAIDGICGHCASSCCGKCFNRREQCKCNQEELEE